MGMLDAPIRSDFVASVPTSDAADIDVIAPILEELAGRADEFVTQECGEFAAAAQVSRLVDLRYRGQSYELTVPWAGSPAGLREVFDRAHRERYGFDDAQAQLEIVAARCSVSIPVVQTVESRLTDLPAVPVPSDKRPVFFGDSWHETPIYQRDELASGTTISGPLIIDQLDSTVVVAPDQHCRVDDHGFLHITPEDKS